MQEGLLEHPRLHQPAKSPQASPPHL
ncbi:hypothetical protein GN244_ATG09124 [Phytophthora infestans]|uniref:Uncharacterized protein n=1 Tax=Phytophthora infestans TaxID=4787 RepID=A0A833SUJ5_PHYIN|nr:hypothetical protein GN244_ATG09124 [Phytophthora infestans]